MHIQEIVPLERFHDILVSQYGSVDCLPEKINTIGGNYTVDYYVETGAIKKLIVGSEALNPESTSSLLENVKTAIDTEKNRDEELSDLERKHKMLELQK